jgi:LysW-gamma-L-lysine carboxypeptidase
MLSVKFWREAGIEDYAVKFLVQLLKIYSPSSREKEIGAFISDEMERLGFKVRTDEAGNVIGEVGCGKPEIMLCSHMDTVPGYIPVRLVDGKLYGRGAVDAKSSLAAMILAAHNSADYITKGKISVAGVVEEEKSSRGVKNLINNGVYADYAVFGEPSNADNIIIGYRGCLKVKITCETQSGHSAAPWMFENSIEKMFELWKMIKEIRFPNENLKSYFYSLSSCIIGLKGGGSTNQVPSKCQALIDIRVPPQLTCMQVYEEIANMLRKYQAECSKVKVDVEAVNMTEPFETERNNPLVASLSWAIRKVRGKTPALIRKTGTADMNMLGNALKIPTVAYGPGNSSLDHTALEHIEIKEYLSSIHVIQEFLKKLLS